MAAIGMEMGYVLFLALLYENRIIVLLNAGAQQTGAQQTGGAANSGAVGRRAARWRGGTTAGGTTAGSRLQLTDKMINLQDGIPGYSA